jgi:DNA-binding NtrC family response regulator
LRDRKGDIHLLFRKFAGDFADRYRMPTVQLLPEARQLLEEYRWPGNIRQLKNVTEQLSILEQQKEISPETLLKYLPSEQGSAMPVLLREDMRGGGEFSERELLYKVLFDMKKDLTELKKVVATLMSGTPVSNLDNPAIETEAFRRHVPDLIETQPGVTLSTAPVRIDAHEEVTEEPLSLVEKEKELIRKAIVKHKGKRREAARELGISERTLYRKINEYDIKE